MKVVFTPWSDKNPYQRQLADALEKLGHKIIPYQPGKPLSLLRFVLKNGKPDIFHFHWIEAYFIKQSPIKATIASILFIIEIITLKFMRVKLIWTVHNIINHEKIHPELEKALYKILIRLYDRIIHLSRSSISIMNNMHMLSSREINKFHVVPHGNYIGCYQNSITPTNARTMLGINHDSIVLLCFGSIRPYKGIEILIHALKKIPDQHIHLLVAGKPQNALIEKGLCQYCENDKRIKTFLYTIPDNDVQIFMNAADIVVLPYIDILNSGAAILAMSFGKPVIAPDIGSIPELIDECGGVLFEPKDINSLAYAIEQSVSMDLESMGRYNFEKISHLSWDSIASQTADIYATKK